MRNSLIIGLLSISVLSISSCDKFDGFANASEEADFELQLYREQVGGSNKLDVEHGINLPGATEGNIIIEPKQTEVHIRVGGIQLTTVVPRIWAYMVFRHTNKPAEIVGEYEFPRDLDKLKFTMTERLPNDDLHLQTDPVSGKIKISFDPATNTYNGIITDIQFTLSISSPYSFQKLNGKINHVPVKE